MSMPDVHDDEAFDVKALPGIEIHGGKSAASQLGAKVGGQSKPTTQ